MTAPGNHPAPPIAARLRGGDHAALDRLIDEQHERCVQLAMRFTGRDRSFAEDAAQDAFIRLIKRPPRTQPGPVGDEHTVRWLRSAVRSACLDQLRSEARRKRRELGAHAEHARPGARRGSEGLDPIVLDRLRAQLASMHDEERDLLIRHFVHGRSATDLARSLGINRETLRGRIRRTLATLAEGWRTAP